ncbi:MAG: hypothetical protein DRP08_06870, partial [Candidatus Aenigmatarchaeota archaeon]
MASQIIEIISGESVTIGDIVNDNGEISGEPFSGEYYCHVKAIDSNGKCAGATILAERDGPSEVDDGEGNTIPNPADLPFKIELPPAYTTNWDGKITLVVTVENFEPYTDEAGLLVTNQGAI